MLCLADFIDKNSIVFPEVNTKEEVLQILIDKTSSKSSDPAVYKHDIFEREKLLSTGIGCHTAVPHLKTPLVNNFFIAVAIHKNGIDWHSLDEQPVHFVFLISGPEDHLHYLQILAALVTLVKRPGFRQKLDKSISPEEVMGLFREFNMHQ